MAAGLLGTPASTSARRCSTCSSAPPRSPAATPSPPAWATRWRTCSSCASPTTISATCAACRAATAGPCCRPGSFPTCAPSRRDSTSTPCRRAAWSSRTRRSCACAGRSWQRSWSRRRCSTSSTSRPSSPPRPPASARPRPARRCWSSACAGPRASTVGSAPRARVHRRRRRHLERAGRGPASASRCAAPTPTRWVMVHQRAGGLPRLRRRACPATAPSWSTPTTR
jgi:hypothetical protein